MTEIILLVIAFELLMAMSLAVTCITIYVLGKKSCKQETTEINDEFIEEERKRAEKLQKQFENMMSYTGRERVDED
ncbi:MAG: hypothetical protein EOM45_08535 [Clostridia bacterium]|nr:hypothetical protein [Clostridia bacterium]